MPANNKKVDPDKADEQRQEVPVVKSGKLSAARIRDARFLGGVWVDADGRPYDAADVRQIHQARDKEALEERQRALLGGG